MSKSITGLIISAAIKSHKEAERERQRQEKQAIAERARAYKRREAEYQKRLREQAKQAQQEAKSRKIIAEMNAKLEHSRSTLADRYATYLQNHKELCKQIEAADKDGRVSDLIIFCEEDARLIPMIYDYHTRKSVLEGVECRAETPDVYKRLSIAYEQTGDFDRAVLACKDAIDMGITEGMQERIEELQQKSKELLIYG